MKFLAEEVEGAVAANNIKGLLVSEYSIKPSLENFNVRFKPVTKIISTRHLELQAFESPSSFSQTRRQVLFQLSSTWDKSKVNNIAFENLNKYASHPPPPTDISRIVKNKRLKLEDPDDPLSNLPIEILIVADFYWNVGKSEPPVKLSDSLTLFLSIFGCILSDPRSHATVSYIPIAHNINVDTQPLYYWMDPPPCPSFDPEYPHTSP
ncbi:uncharacterized protein NPIL_458731 [Nephila pilipes]|uniref:Uncharacterized protein n=1 Tax=Nephila pilipes TaxID=299642 RepID=A0A8X6KKG4_NEPPI|nr:uncharacterized protein NPIL_458731 [Nephila pilipes]